MKSENNRHFYVYKHQCKLCDTSNGIYIGITSKADPKYRWGLNGNGYKKQKKIYETILQWGPENWENEEVWTHEIIYSNLTEKEAYLKEQELIYLYDSYYNGLNSSLGGEINIKYQTTEEAEIAYRASKKKKIYKRINNPKTHAIDLERSRNFIANKRQTDPEYKNFDNRRNLELYNEIKNIKDQLCQLDLQFPSVLSIDEKLKIHGALYKCRSKKYLNELLLKFNISK